MTIIVMTDDDGDYDDDYKLMMVMRMMITMSTGR